MAWYWWLVIALAAMVLVTLIAFWALRATHRGRRFLALSTRAKLTFGRALLASPDVGIGPRVLLFIIAAYLLMPIDIIPDFIPVLGQVDDIAAIVVAVAILVLIVPGTAFEQALNDAESTETVRDV